VLRIRQFPPFTQLANLVSGVRPDSAIAIRGLDETHGNRPGLGGKPIYNFSWVDQLDDTRLASNV